MKRLLPLLLALFVALACASPVEHVSALTIADVAGQAGASEDYQAGASGEAGAGPTPYLGQVATRTAAPHNLGNSAYYMVETMHYARDTICSIAVAWPNWATSSETPTGGTLTVVASIEYPIGTETRLPFSGGITGSASPTTLELWSDATSIPGCIPEGGLFGVRFLQRNTVHIPFTSSGDQHNVALGDAVHSGGTDQTMGGTIVDNSPTISMWPIAIIGWTTHHSAAIFGDSINAGFGDTILDSSGDVGEVARGLGGAYAYMKLANSGETAAVLAAHHNERVALAQYTDTIVYALGVNDLRASVSAATLETEAATFAANFPGKRFIPVTITPNARSTDNWATLAGQIVPGNDGQRVLLDSHIRANPEAYAGFLEAAGAIESAGKWDVDGTAFKYTGDGLHPSTFGYKCFSFVLPP